MKCLTLTVLGLSLAAPILSGCTTEHEKTVSHNPFTGTTTVKDTTSTTSDGNTTTTTNTNKY